MTLHKQWPETNERIDNIGRNAGDGAHYNTSIVDYTKATESAFAYAKKRRMTNLLIADKAGVTENTVIRAKKGKPVTMQNWAAIIMACGYTEIQCVLKTK